MLLELRDHDLADLLGQPGQPAGRQLFAADFEQQFAIHVRPRLDRLAVAALADVRLGDADRELPHAQDVGRALGDADAVARVEDVEQVRALQPVLERRPDQPDCSSVSANR